MDFTGERFLSDGLNSQISSEHWHRYDYIKNICKNKKVLDIACGEGYGSYFLSLYAQHVIGGDISEESINFANNKYKNSNLTYIQCDIKNIPLDDNSIDIIVSFETIEHVDSSTQLKFLEEIQRILKEDGTLIMSTPDKLNYSDKKNFKNEFHIQEFYKKEYHSFLNIFFKNINFLYQNFSVNSLIYDEKDLNLKINSFDNNSNNKINQGYSDFEYIIAVCSNNTLNNIDLGCSLLMTSLSKYKEELKHEIYYQNNIFDLKTIIEQKENYIQEQRSIIEQKENYIQEQRSIIEHLQSNILNRIILIIRKVIK